MAIDLDKAKRNKVFRSNLDCYPGGKFWVEDSEDKKTSDLLREISGKLDVLIELQRGKEI